jgi:hypothetical protein
MYQFPDWTDDRFIEKYESGLNKFYHDWIIQFEFNSFEELVNRITKYYKKVNKVALQYSEGFHEKKGSSSGKEPDDDAMEIDAIRRANAKGSASNEKHCDYCNKASHYFSQCYAFQEDIILMKESQKTKRNKNTGKYFSLAKVGIRYCQVKLMNQLIVIYYWTVEPKKVLLMKTLFIRTQLKLYH